MAEEKESKDSAEDVAGQAKKSVGLVETMGCCCLNLGCFFLILAFLSLVAMIVGVVSNPLKALSSVVSHFWGLLKIII